VPSTSISPAAVTCTRCEICPAVSAFALGSCTDLVSPRGPNASTLTLSLAAVVTAIQARSPATTPHVAEDVAI
jgi:hypothetical protein